MDRSRVCARCDSVSCYPRLADDEENEAGTESTPSYIEAIAQLTSKFKVPLESAGAVVANVGDEFHDLLQYTIQFISVPVTRWSGEKSSIHLMLLIGPAC